MTRRQQWNAMSVVDRSAFGSTFEMFMLYVTGRFNEFFSRYDPSTCLLTDERKEGTISLPQPKDST